MERASSLIVGDRLLSERVADTRADRQRLSFASMVFLSIFGALTFTGTTLVSYILAHSHENNSVDQDQIVSEKIELPLSQTEELISQPDPIDQITELEQSVTAPQVSENQATPFYSAEQIRALSDREIIGVIVSRRASETNLLQALRAARSKSINGLADAAVFALKRRSVSVRLEALSIVSEIGSAKNTPDLAELLNDESPVIRLKAAQALAHIGDSSATTALSNRIGREEVLSVRDAIMRALTQVQSSNKGIQ